MRWYQRQGHIVSRTTPQPWHLHKGISRALIKELWPSLNKGGTISWAGNIHGMKGFKRKSRKTREYGHSLSLCCPTSMTWTLCPRHTLHAIVDQTSEKYQNLSFFAELICYIFCHSSEMTSTNTLNLFCLN